MTRRPYQSPRRSEQAADTRAQVVAAARAVFVEDGWRKATIAGVAMRAGVSAETIYASFGNKPQLLLAVVHATARRREPGVAVVDQPGAQAVAGAPDQRAALKFFALDVTDLLAGVAPVMAVVREAARSEPEVAQVYEAIHRGRRDNFTRVAMALTEKGTLRQGVDATAVVAEVWRLASPELYLLMTGIEGLSQAQFAAWLERTLARLLLPDA